MDKIETAFEDLKQSIKNGDGSGLSEHDKILLVLRNKPEKIWWLAHHLLGWHEIGGKRFFIGYEVTARFSEVAQDETLIESRRCGKYMARRLLK